MIKKTLCVLHMSVEQRMLTINLLQLVAKVIANFTMFRFVFFVCVVKSGMIFLSPKINYPSFSRQNLLTELTACRQNHIEAFILHIAD